MLLFRLRGRENNKMSPTGRKAVRRSSSVSLVEGSRVSGVIPSGTPIKAKKSPRPSKVSYVHLSLSKLHYKHSWSVLSRKNKTKTEVSFMKRIDLVVMQRALNVQLIALIFFSS